LETGGSTYSLELGEGRLSDERSGNVLLSDCPHKESLNWGDGLVHVVSMETETSFESQTVSRSEASWSDLFISKYSITEGGGVFWSDRNFESVLALRVRNFNFYLTKKNLPV
jgi:sugar lactone lactonase YvrE